MDKIIYSSCPTKLTTVWQIGDKVVILSGTVPVEGYVKDILLFETRILTPDKSTPSRPIYAHK